MTNGLCDEGFEVVHAGGCAGVCFTDDGDDGGYSAETGEDVDIQCVETVVEGVMVVRRSRIDHV